MIYYVFVINPLETPFGMVTYAPEEYENVRFANDLVISIDLRARFHSSAYMPGRLIYK